MTLSYYLLAVPPGIVGENKLEDVKVKSKHRVTLTCEVIGKSIQFYLRLVIKPVVSIIAGSEQLVFNGIFSSVEFLNFRFNHGAYSRTKHTFLER